MWKLKYVKGCFALSRLLWSDLLFFNVLIWSSIKNFEVSGSEVLGPGSCVLGFRVLDPESRVVGPYLDYACYQLFSFPYFRSSPGDVLLGKVFLEISQNSQENTCCKVSLLIKLQAVSTAWSFSGLLLLKISCLFHFNRKMKWGKYPDGLEILIYFFARVLICLRSKITKKFGRW